MNKAIVHVPSPRVPKYDKPSEYYAFYNKRLRIRWITRAFILRFLYEKNGISGHKMQPRGKIICEGFSRFFVIKNIPKKQSENITNNIFTVFFCDKENNHLCFSLRMWKDDKLTEYEAFCNRRLKKRWIRAFIWQIWSNNYNKRNKNK